MMHSFKTIGLVAAALAATVAPATAFAADREFTVKNGNAKVSVQRVWYAQAGTSEVWQEVFLDYPIKPSTSSGFTLPEGNVCLYDVKIQFSDDYVQTFANVNVCRHDYVDAT
ncbi:hypothetical protein [uncultured Sphingomonas sp.]|uniref:hypothetical protein n=1 Tax=uncultured Sphingomonas sp. TaxID=158754 RepID=UPI0035CBBB5F